MGGNQTRGKPPCFPCEMYQKWLILSNPFAIQYSTVHAWCNKEVFCFDGYMLTVRKLLSGHMDKIPDLPFASCTVGPHGADRFSSLLTGTRQAWLCWALSSDLASRDSGYTHRLVIQQARCIRHREHGQGLEWKVSETAHLRWWFRPVQMYLLEKVPCLFQGLFLRHRATSPSGGCFLVCLEALLGPGGFGQLSNLWSWLWGRPL